MKAMHRGLAMAGALCACGAAVSMDLAPRITTPLTTVPAPASSSAAPAAPSTAGIPTASLQALSIPVAGVAAKDLVDTFAQARSAGRRHDAIDIMASRGTRVCAVNDGSVVKLFDSRRGGLTVYQIDASQRVLYYYAHLDAYAPGLHEGQPLHRGDAIGAVGSTGDADPGAPHLHFELQLLGPERQWWKATSIDPYPALGGR